MNQREGFIRVFFSSDNLSNKTQSKFLEEAGISSHISFEGSTVQQTHNQSVRDSVLKQVGYVKAGEIAMHAEGSDFTAYWEVGSQLFVVVSLGRQGLVHGFIQTELTQMKSVLKIPFHQSPCQSYSIQKQVGTFEMKFHLDFHAWYQYFASVKHFQMRRKYQTLSRSCGIVCGFCYRESQGSFVIDTEIPVVCMRRGPVCVVGSPLGWEIHYIEPALRCQHGLSILSVKIQQVFYVGLVMIRV